MEIYIKPSTEVVKIEAQAALLDFSADRLDRNQVDLAPIRKDFSNKLTNFDVWKKWDDGTEEEEYAISNNSISN